MRYDNSVFRQWIVFFLKGVVVTADSAVDAAKQIMELQSRHRNLLWQKKISSPLAVGILESSFLPLMSWSTTLPVIFPSHIRQLLH